MTDPGTRHLGLDVDPPAPPGLVDRVRRSALVLAAAGVPSPESDARRLAAFVLGVSVTRLPLIVEITDEQDRRIVDLVRRRALREPLQHIVGFAPFMDLELTVGPGVFVPRPETEQLADWFVRSRADSQRATVVDLCCGSGALAIALAVSCPGTVVHAVEIDPAARRYAEINVDRYRERAAAVDSQLHLHAGDVRVCARPGGVLVDLRGSVDLVVSNPPYVPVGSVPRDPEVHLHDPAAALYGGEDGYDVIRALLDQAALLLRPGGELGLEHGDLQGEAAAGGGVPGLVRAHRTDGRPTFGDVADHEDLAGRPRFTTGRRSGAADG